MQGAICEAFGIVAGANVGAAAVNLAQILDLAVREISSLHDLGSWNDIAFDGPAIPNVTKEDEMSLSYCGLFWTLGGKASRKVPVRVKFEKDGGAVNYQLWLGCDDERWKELSDSKQWERTYLECHEEGSTNWEWSEHVSGKVENVISGI